MNWPFRDASMLDYERPSLSPTGQSVDKIINRRVGFILRQPRGPVNRAGTGGGEPAPTGSVNSRAMRVSGRGVSNGYCMRSWTTANDTAVIRQIDELPIHRPGETTGAAPDATGVPAAPRRARNDQPASGRRIYLFLLRNLKIERDNHVWVLASVHERRPKFGSAAGRFSPLLTSSAKVRAPKIAKAAIHGAHAY
jgi:hypothetical protein